MFSPADQVLERGWPERIGGEVVVQLAAQTLQAFFTGGGDAREHAVYPLDETVFRAAVLHPPAIRIFDSQGDFSFANPAAVPRPGDEVLLSAGVDAIEAQLRLAAMTGADSSIAGFTL